MIAVRRLAPDDWEMWRQLRRQALTEAPEVFGSVLAEWSGPRDTEARWRARLTDIPFNAVVLWCGAPAGMVSAYLPDTGAVELISLWISPFARGRGVGDAAVEAVVNWADGGDVGLSVKSGNRAAIRLYRRHGFVEVGCSPDDSGERRMLRSTSTFRKHDAR